MYSNPIHPSSPHRTSLLVETQDVPIEPRATFYGGIWAGLVPLGVFLSLVLGLVIIGAPTTEGMIVAAMVGITAGMFFARDYGTYCERLFSLMANRVATVAIVCWLWAGAFSGLLSMSGLVEAIVWLGSQVGLQRRSVRRCDIRLLCCLCCLRWHRTGNCDRIHRRDVPRRHRAGCRPGRAVGRDRQRRRLR